MNKQTKITIAVLIIFVVGMSISIAFVDPASAAKYKGKKSLTVTVKDCKKTVKIKCKYKSGYGGSYSGKKENILLLSGNDQNKVRLITVGIPLPKILRHQSMQQIRP